MSVPAPAPTTIPGSVIVSVSRRDLLEKEKSLLKHPKVAGLVLFSDNYFISPEDDLKALMVEIRRKIPSAQIEKNNVPKEPQLRAAIAEVCAANPSLLVTNPLKVNKELEAYLYDLCVKTPTFFHKLKEIPKGILTKAYWAPYITEIGTKYPGWILRDAKTAKEDLINLVKQIRALNPNLLLMVDNEGGKIWRFPHHFNKLPAAKAWGLPFSKSRQPWLQKAYNEACAKILTDTNSLQDVGLNNALTLGATQCKQGFENANPMVLKQALDTAWKQAEEKSSFADKKKLAEIFTEALKLANQKYDEYLKEHCARAEEIFLKEISDQIADYAAVMASELLHDCDIDMCLGPVADLDGPNTVIGGLERAVHNDPAIVIKILEQHIRGMNRAGMLATLKHYPGHGSCIADTHLGRTVDGRSIEELLADLSVFNALIDKTDLQFAIMTAHVIYDAIDANNPAGFSSKWIDILRNKANANKPATSTTASSNTSTVEDTKANSEILRSKSGFKGLIMTDCLNMEGANIGNAATRIRKSREAGCDLQMCTGQWGEALDQLLQCLDSLGDTAENNESIARRIAFLQTVQTLKKRPKPDANFNTRLEAAKSSLAALNAANSSSNAGTTITPLTIKGPNSANDAQKIVTASAAATIAGAVTIVATTSHNAANPVDKSKINK